jgi:hypothetical protein
MSGVKLLTNFPDRDLVTDILRSVTLKTVVLGRAELRAPWGLHYDLPGRAVFHIVLRGQCWMHANGANCVQVNCGDMLLFPSADPHDISDHPATPIRPLQEMLIRHPMTQEKLFRFGGKGPPTTMLCGAFHLDDPKLNLMGALLPPLLHLRNRGDRASAQLRALTRCIETELKISRPGEQAIVTRMAEAFLLRAIRDHVLASSNGGHGLSAILRDPSIARVLGLIHQRPEQAWTVNSLANEVARRRDASVLSSALPFQPGCPALADGHQDVRNRPARRVRFRSLVQQGLQTADGQIAGRVSAGEIGDTPESLLSSSALGLLARSVQFVVEHQLPNNIGHATMHFVLLCGNGVLSCWL